MLYSRRRPPWLERRVLAMLFEKPSMRTRVSFEAGIGQLGGTAMFLGEEVGWKSREATADFVRMLAQYAIMSCAVPSRMLQFKISPGLMSCLLSTA